LSELALNIVNCKAKEEHKSEVTINNREEISDRYLVKTL